MQVPSAAMRHMLKPKHFTDQVGWVFVKVTINNFQFLQHFWRHIFTFCPWSAWCNSQANKNTIKIMLNLYHKDIFHWLYSKRKDKNLHQGHQYTMYITYKIRSYSYTNIINVWQKKCIYISTSTFIFIFMLLNVRFKILNLTNKLL